MEKELIEEIMLVRETGLANMFYCGEVYEVAQQLNLTLLESYLKESVENRRRYFEFIRSGGNSPLLD